MHVVAEKLYTPEELLSIADGKDYELVDGRLVERNMSVLSSWVGGQLYSELNVFLRDNPLGWAWPSDLGYACFPDAPKKVRKPDVTYIRKERLPEGLTSEGYEYLPPDLAVEVVSPNDSYYEVEAKVIEYLDAGVSLIWIVDPESRTVRIHRRDGSVAWLRQRDELSGEDVVPGFRCPVSAIFPGKRQEPEAGA